MSALEISLLGPLVILVDGKPIEVASNYVRALLCFLAIEKNRPYCRDALAEMLWPGKPESVARNSLKQALSNLRKALGDRNNSTPFLLISRNDIQFNQSSDYQVDAVEFTELVETHKEHLHQNLETCKSCEKQLLRAVELYQGDFLLDFYLPDNQEFNDWVIIKREVFQRQISDVFSKLALIHEIRDEYTLAIDDRYQLTDLEPWNEENHRNLMRLLAHNGMRGAALRQFQVCCDCLKRELGVDPSNATVNLYEAIKTWEPETFTDDEPLQILPIQSPQIGDPEEDAPGDLFITRTRTRRNLITLIIAGFILVIGSAFLLGVARNPVVAIALENFGITQTQSDTSIPIKAPLPDPTETDSIVRALTAVGSSKETTSSEQISVPATVSSATMDYKMQSQALVALYEQTDGLHWENSDGWLSDLPACEWYGVTCRGEKVVELELDHNQLNGDIPSEISQLAYLENLDLGNNQLNGDIPSEIGTLLNLRQLTLWGNPDLSGPIPPELGSLSNLEELRLAHWESGGSRLSGEIPPELGNLKKLRSLSISVSLLRGPLPVELCALINLEDLYLDSNQLSGPIPPEIGNMINLGVLDLGGNDFEGPIPPELGSLAMLDYLAVGGNLVSGEIPPELGNLARLRYLVLDNTNLSGPLPLTLMNLNLRELTFFGTDVCEPANDAFQVWLDGIDDLLSTDEICPP